ncbi:cilia- and flagella-associated protein 99-like [Prorops nasuta]|uniref:cilia- and flagella-associated protein 99-like n=1 Tax=Prorops nasuta TaxID=863751 RepID=UPI0034CD6B9F
MVFLYIMIFQASILLGENIENSFKYLQASKILQLLSFLQLSSTFQFLTISACSIFDETFVRDKISKPFLDNLPTLKVITAHLQQHINARNYLRKTTKPIFMNVLHRSKKLPCIPSSTQKEINVKISATKLPNSTYNRPNEEQKLTVLRHENKLRAFQLLNNATKNAPTCLQRLKKFPKKNNLNEKKCYRKRITRLPMISEIEVEETTASILRRYTRVMKDKAKLIKKLQMLSEGGLDESAIEMLNQKEKMEKIKREKKIIQEKHLSALLSRKKASLAKQESLKKVKERADLTRKESKELCERFRKGNNDMKLPVNQFIFKKLTQTR